MVWCLPVIFSASSQTVSFYNQDERGSIQRVTFDSEQVKRIFHGSFHKVRPPEGPSAGQIQMFLLLDENFSVSPAGLKDSCSDMTA